MESADVLYGSARHLALVPRGGAVRQCWPSPMAPAIEEILTGRRGQNKVTVLASGDPMLYGVGVTLTRHLHPAEFRVVPQVSALSLACARLGWAIAKATLISLVHRPIEQLYRYLSPGERLIVFSEDGTTPAAIAKALQESGFGSSQMIVFERLGGSSERRIDTLVASWADQRCGDLNVVAVVCIPDAGTSTLSIVPGLPDDAFETDGQLTKREVRAVTLARLAPLPGQRLWDVGAGTGSIAIEWMRAHPSCSALAFEKHSERANRIRHNAAALGVPGLHVIQGTAPNTFENLEGPDAIFVGGGLDEEMMDVCWASLSRGGRLVVNAVTVASEVMLAALYEAHGGDLVRLQITRADAIGRTLGWRPLMPITQWAVVKP